ncbi:MAG: DUF7901 domain-containing protein, partial [Planctomycetota bacterium]
MRKLMFFVCVFVLLTGLGAGPILAAQLVEFEFGGTVTNVQPGISPGCDPDWAGVTIGQPWSIIYVFEANTPDTDGLPDHASYYAITSYTLNIAGNTAEDSGLAGEWISVFSDRPVGFDQYEVWITLQTGFRWVMQLDDDTNAAWNTDALPLCGDIELLDFGVRNFLLYNLLDPVFGCEITGTVDYHRCRDVIAGDVKWIQPPDKTKEGMDIRVDRSDGIDRTLADDFECTTKGPITDVHFWGSWLRDIKGNMAQIHLSIHKDIPANPADPKSYSMPGTLLWEKDFFVGDFVETMAFDLSPDYEWWWDVYDAQSFPDPDGDQKIWRYDIVIDPNEAFIQEGTEDEPIVYWLDIWVRTEQGEFGWKTSREHWNDDAVYANPPGISPPWNELIYPSPHPLWPESIDMAFAITTKVHGEPKLPVDHLKWSQPPIEINPASSVAGYKLYATAYQGGLIPDRLLSINPSTGAGSLIGNMSTSLPWGLSDRGMELYTFDTASDGNSVVRLDPTTGNTMYKIAINPPDIIGEGALAFRSDGIGFLGSCFNQLGELYNFDLSVSSSTHIGAFQPSMDGLDFDGNDVLYGLEQGTGSSTYKLYTINQATGATSLVGDTGVTVRGNVSGLTFAPDGTLFAAIRYPLDPNTYALYTLDPGTGAASLVGPIGFSRITGLTALATEPTLPVFCGWDEPSYAPQPAGAPLMKFVADDYLCIGSMPVTSIHWWGSYLGWDSPIPPLPQPQSWLITFWSNVPPGVANFSYPETPLWQIRVQAPRVEVEYAGQDEFQLDPDFRPEACFQFYLDLKPDELFWQQDYLEKTKDNIFWISIVAIYDSSTQVGYPWGWKTRPWSWMDDAVTFNLNAEIPLGAILDPAIVRPIEYQGESYDVAFELDTDPNYIKWEQPFTGLIHWPHYEDVNSMAVEKAAGDIRFINLVADDWLCRRQTPVTAVVWWGSYIGYEYQACKDMTMARPVKPDYFRLSIWTDVPDPDPTDPDTFSHPNEIIWKYDAHENDYAEVLVGYDKHPHATPGAASAREPVFRYSVRIPEANWFLQEDVNNIYWLSVVAVYKEGTDPTYDWGWTNHEHVFNDDAVTGSFDQVIGEWDWNELHDQTGQSEDMSFILFTEPGCFPATHPDYFEWLAVGKPDCWCCPRQCHGNATPTCEPPGGSAKTGFYYVGPLDLNTLVAAWLVLEPGFGPGIASVPNGICADFAHDLGGSAKTGF